MNLWQKIIEVRKSISALTKDKEGYQYSYVTGNQILSKIKDKMDDMGLLLQPSTQVGEYERHDYKNQYGKDKIDFLVKGQGAYTWINAEEPTEREVVEFAYYGQQSDDLSKAYGTALTYRERYFLLKYFGLPTDEDDPDAKQEEHKPSKPNKTTVTTHKTMPKTYTNESVFDFGNNKGKTFGQVFKENPSYFDWLSKNAKDDALKEFSKRLWNYHEKNKVVNTNSKDVYGSSHADQAMESGLMDNGY